jgi:NAD(P)-dependent dehydrogenase (short-subunit alcohol dehydrogenase family)
MRGAPVVGRVVESAEMAGRLEDKVVVITGAGSGIGREAAVRRSGVWVNALCPGPVETPLLMRLFADDQAAFERRRVHLPMGRLAKPPEVAQGALFLASDESSYVAGATFLVDGGTTAAYVTPE